MNRSTSWDMLAVRRAAVALILNEQGQILLTKRAASRDRFPSYWELPGGELELGESAESGVIRELEEEVGVKVRVTGHVRSVIALEPLRKERWSTDVLSCTIVEGTPTNCEPNLCVGVGFFDMDALPAPLLPETVHDIAAYRARVSLPNVSAGR